MKTKIESFTDCTGTRRKFELSQGPQSIDNGYVITARERTEEEFGYKFSAWSPVLGDALGKVRQKIRQGLSIRYLTDSPFGGLDMSHGKLSGLISCDGVVVDGNLIKWDALITLLTTYEGHQFDLNVTDPTE